MTKNDFLFQSGKVLEQLNKLVDTMDEVAGLSVWQDVDIWIQINKARKAILEARKCCGDSTQV